MKICIDAGHYGKYNRSPAVSSYWESERMWKLHLLLKKELEAYGVTVVTTRSEQAKDLALTSRGKASKGCDLFISMHSNAVGSSVNEKTDYPIAILGINGKADKIGEKLAKCVASIMGTKQAAKTTKKTQKDGRDWYGVLRGAAEVGTAGVILEHSFHTQTAATKWLLNDGNLEKLAKAEAECIAEHYGLKKIASGTVAAGTAATKAVKYYVQAGAFSNKANAEALVARLNKAGFSAYIKTE